MTRIDSWPASTVQTAPSATRWRVRAGVAVLGAATVATLAGCGSSSSPRTTMPSTASPAGASSMPATDSSSSPAAEPAVITIDKFAYGLPASVSPGAKITVQNKDGDNHTVTADDSGGFDVKADAGASAVFTAPMAPGSYPFHCLYHSNMHGVLIVK